MKMFLISLEIKWFTAFDVSETQVELVGRWKLSRFGCSRFACVFDVLSTNIQLFMPNKNYFACLLLKPFYPISKVTLFAFESVQSIVTNLRTLRLTPPMKNKQFIVFLISGSAKCRGIFLIRL